MTSDLGKIKKHRAMNSKIRALANSIRKKYLALKLGKAEIDEEVENFLKPVSEPLRKLVKNIERNPLQQQQSSPQPSVVKEEEQTLRYSTRFPGRRSAAVVKPEDEVMKASTPEKEKLDISMMMAEKPENISIIEPSSSVKNKEDTFFYNAEEEDEDNEVFNPNQTLQDIARSSDAESMLQYLEQYPTIARQYVTKYIDNPDEFDTIYGLRIDPNEDKWYIGSK